MGTKGGKPITAIEKRQLRQLREELRRRREEEKKERRPSLDMVDPSIIDKIGREIRSMGIVTPFAVCQRFGVKYSVAKKVIKELAARGVLDIVLKSRRIIVAVPRGSRS